MLVLFVRRFSVWNVELFSLFIFWLLFDFSSGCDPRLYLTVLAHIKSVTKSAFYDLKYISSLRPYKSLHAHAPQYLADPLHLYTPSQTLQSVDSSTFRSLAS